MNMQKTIPYLLIFLTTISYIGSVSALRVEECEKKYDDCMNAWFTTQGGCNDSYLECRAARGEE